MLHIRLREQVLTQHIKAPKYGLLDLESVRGYVNNVHIAAPVRIFIRDIIISCRQHPAIVTFPPPSATEAFMTAAKYVITVMQ